jgi:hypothetical protein
MLVALSALPFLACSGNQPCQGSSCGGTTVTPVILVITCGGSPVVQSTLTGTCAAGGFSCQAPAEAGIADCTTASFAATGPGQCEAELTFANGFVYSGSFTFTQGADAIVPSPEVVPVFCLTDAGEPDTGTMDATGD